MGGKELNAPCHDNYTALITTANFSGIYIFIVDRAQRYFQKITHVTTHVAKLASINFTVRVKSVKIMLCKTLPLYGTVLSSNHRMCAPHEPKIPLTSESNLVFNFYFLQLLSQVLVAPLPILTCLDFVFYHLHSSLLPMGLMIVNHSLKRDNCVSVSHGQGKNRITTKGA